MAPKRAAGATPQDPEALQARIKELEKAKVEEDKKRSAAESARKKELSGQQKKLAKEIGLYKGIVKKCEGKAVKLRKEQEKIIGLEKQNNMKRMQLNQKIDDMLVKSEERRKMIALELDQTSAESRAASAKLAYLEQAVTVLKQPLEVLLPEPPSAAEEEPSTQEVQLQSAEKVDAEERFASTEALQSAVEAVLADGQQILTDTSMILAPGPLPTTDSTEVAAEWIEVSAALDSPSSTWPQGSREAASDVLNIQHELRRSLLRLNSIDVEDSQQPPPPPVVRTEDFLQQVKDLLSADGLLSESAAEALAESVTDVAVEAFHVGSIGSAQHTAMDQKQRTSPRPAEEGEDTSRGGGSELVWQLRKAASQLRRIHSKASALPTQLLSGMASAEDAQAGLAAVDKLLRAALIKVSSLLEDEALWKAQATVSSKTDLQDAQRLVARSWGLHSGSALACSELVGSLVAARVAG